MKILIACEESQRVCEAFRKKGKEAYSCDILPTSGSHPEWHIQQDVLPLLNGNCSFTTMDGKIHETKGEWGLIIAFPPCTNLCVSGARFFKEKKRDGRQQKSISFFLEFTKARCDHIAIENPVGIMSNLYMKPTQIIEPFQFGEEARKATCLWLKNLPRLKPTKIVGQGMIGSNGESYGASAMYAKDENGKILSWNDPRTALIRSKTFLGVAQAMADQWAHFEHHFHEQLTLF